MLAMPPVAMLLANCIDNLGSPGQIGVPSCSNTVMSWIFILVGIRRRDTARSTRVRVVHAQQFAHAPRLGEATHGAMRRVAVKNLRDASESRLIHVVEQRLDDFGDLLALCLPRAVDLHVGIAVRADEPRPNRALMIRAIPLPAVARVFRAIPRVLWRQRPQSVRRQ